MTDPVTFSFGDVEYDHIVADAKCDACWDDPTPHGCETPGCLEHTQFGDENADCDYWLYHLGDLCRESS